MGYNLHFGGYFDNGRMHLSRVINPDSAGKERTRLSKSIVLALRALMRQTQPDDDTYDLVAFVSLALQQVYDTVDSSVSAWEKRGYWVKADRFRMEWEWTRPASEILRKAILTDDWAAIAMTAAQIAQKFNKVKVPERHRLGTPWTGAWDALPR